MKDNHFENGILQWGLLICPSMGYLCIRRVLTAIPAREEAELAFITLLLIVLWILLRKHIPVIQRGFRELCCTAMLPIFAGLVIGWISVKISYNAKASGSVWAFLTVCVVGPACEEIIYRGITYELASRLGGPIFAVVISALLFAFGHGGLPQIAFAVPVGLLLGMLRKAKGDFLAPLILHWTINMTVFFLSGAA